MAREELTRLTGNGNGTCGEDDCPNVYRTASGSIVVQGDVSDAFTPPQGKGSWRSPGAFFGRPFVLLDGDDWRAMLQGFQKEAWRLETLPQYLVPQEAEGGGPVQGALPCGAALFSRSLLPERPGQ